MNRTRLAGLVWIFSFFFLEQALGALFPIRVPPLVLITVVFFSLHEGPVAGAYLGVWAGLLLDLLGSGKLGPQMGIYASVGFITGLSSNLFFKDSWITKIVLPLLAYLLMNVLSFMVFKPSGPWTQSWPLLLFLDWQKLLVLSVTALLLFSFLKSRSVTS